VSSDSLTERGQVLIKIDGYADFDELQLTSIKLSDEKPEVGDRIVVLSKPTDWFDIGATGIVQCADGLGMLVKFDEGVYLRSGKVHTWYVGNYRKIGIIRDIEGAYKHLHLQLD